MPTSQTLLVSSNTQAFLALSDVFSRLAMRAKPVPILHPTIQARAAALATVEQDMTLRTRLVHSMFTLSSRAATCSFRFPSSLRRSSHVSSTSSRSRSRSIPHANARLGQPSRMLCRRWRQVALDDPTLWTHFSDFPRNKDWIAERLSRARNAPLVIDLGGSMVSKTRYPCSHPAHLPHARALHPQSVFLSLEIVQEINIQKAPALERLGLSVSTLHPPNKHQGAFWGPRSSRGRFRNYRSFASLKSSSLGALVPRGRLTELQVTHSDEVSTVTPKVSPHGDLNQLIDLLVNCPALEILTLETACPAMVNESSRCTNIEFTVHAFTVCDLAGQVPASRTL